MFQNRFFEKSPKPKGKSPKKKKNKENGVLVCNIYVLFSTRVSDDVNNMMDLSQNKVAPYDCLQTNTASL